MLFFTASLLRSSAPLPVFFKLLLRVGEVGGLSWDERLVRDGSFDNRRFGEGLRSFKEALLADGRRSGALERVGRPPVGTLAPLKIF
jgi:hypothetical protein